MRNQWLLGQGRTARRAQRKVLHNNYAVYSCRLFAMRQANQSSAGAARGARR